MSTTDVNLLKKDINFMKEYFKHAATLEKHKCVLEESIKKANQEIAIVNNERNIANNNVVSYGNELADLDQKYSNKENKYNNKMDMAKRNVPRNTKTSIISIILATITLCLSGISYILAVVLVLLAVFGGMNSPAQDVVFSPIPLIFALLFYAISTGLIIFAGACFVVFIVSMILKSVAKSQLKTKKPDFEAKKTNERVNLLASINQAQSRDKALVLSKAKLEKVQHTLFEHYKMVDEALTKHYSMNLVAEDFHDLQSMATFYDYLRTERCTAIAGPGGVIATYKQDIMAAKIIRHLSNIETISRDTNQKIDFLCHQSVEANQSLKGIRSDLSAIRTTGDKLVENSNEATRYCASVDSYLKSSYLRSW